MCGLKATGVEARTAESDFNGSLVPKYIQRSRPKASVVTRLEQTHKPLGSPVPQQGGKPYCATWIAMNHHM